MPIVTDRQYLGMKKKLARMQGDAADYAKRAKKNKGDIHIAGMLFDINRDIQAFSHALRKHRKKLLDAHRKAKRAITKEEARCCIIATDPTKVVDWIVRMDTIRACALLDKMDNLSSALILTFLMLRSKDQKCVKSGDIFNRAHVLEIGGTEGVTCARDNLFKKTGVFLI